MKKIRGIVFFIFSYIALAAQENKVGISFSQNYSTFRFIDSEGKKDDLNFIIKYGYGLSFQKAFEKQLFLEGHVILQ